MNLHRARVVLRPRRLLDSLDLAAPFCVENRRAVGRLLLAPLGAGLLLALGVRVGLGWSWGAVWLPLLTVSIFLQGVYTVMAAELLFRPPEDVRLREVLGRFRRRFWAHALTLFGHQVVLVMAFSTVLLFPVIGARLLFVREAVLLEENGLAGSFRRSAAVSDDHTAGCFVLWLLTLGLPVFFVLAFEVTGQALVKGVLQMGEPVGALFTEGGSGYALAGFLVSMPLVAAARFLRYIDLRTLREGWDIQIRFAAIREQAEAAQRAA